MGIVIVVVTSYVYSYTCSLLLLLLEGIEELVFFSFFCLPTDPLCGKINLSKNFLNSYGLTNVHHPLNIELQLSFRMNLNQIQKFIIFNLVLHIFGTGPDTGITKEVVVIHSVYHLIQTTSRQLVELQITPTCMEQSMRPQMD